MDSLPSGRSSSGSSSRSYRAREIFNPVIQTRAFVGSKTFAAIRKILIYTLPARGSRRRETKARNGRASFSAGYYHIHNPGLIREEGEGRQKISAVDKSPATFTRLAVQRHTHLLCSSRSFFCWAFRVGRFYLFLPLSLSLPSVFVFFGEILKNLFLCARFFYIGLAKAFEMIFFSDW